ncbi:MAG: antibiotic biosynthesis monooxygenase [Chromatiales bacterium]|jgi:quinol monooxygenase YgiN
MTVAFVAKLVVKPDKKDEFEALQKKLSVLTHDHEPDTLVYDFLRHRDEPNTYLVYSRFRDEAAFETHQQSTFHDDLVPPILEALAEEMDLQFFDLIE